MSGNQNQDGPPSSHFFEVSHSAVERIESLTSLYTKDQIDQEMFMVFGEAFSPNEGYEWAGQAPNKTHVLQHTLRRAIEALYELRPDLELKAIRDKCVKCFQESKQAGSLSGCACFSEQ